MDGRMSTLNGKGLMVSISEEPRSISPSPQPGQPMQMASLSMIGPGGGMNGMNMGMGMSGSGGGGQHSHSHGNMSAGGGGGGGGGGDSPYMHEQEESSGEGETSQFGRAKKPKRKAAPRTSRACLACRRQKMRCEGAENPPCRRCIQNEVDCMFERRSDYLLNPEDRAWQNSVEKRLEHLSRTIDMILAHLGGPSSIPQPPSTAAAFPEMPPAAAYFESYERHGMPATAPAGPADMNNSGGGRINYVVPSPAETAAIAAQARMKRSRGNTLPSNLPSAGFAPETGFQLFSPRTAALDTAGLPNPYSYGNPTPGPHSSQEHHGHLHQHQHPHPHQHQPHPSEMGQHNAGGPGQYSHSSHAYSFDTYPGPSALASGSGAGGPPGGGLGPNDQSNGMLPGAGGNNDLIPRSLGSPSVRFAHHPSMSHEEMHGELGVPPLHGAEGAA